MVARAGGKVVFLGGSPKWIAGANIRDARGATAADFTWATVVDQQLPPTPVPGQFPPATAPEPQSVAPEIERVVDAAATRTVKVAAPTGALRVMKRRWRDADVYLLFNEGAKALDTTVTLPGSRGEAQLWDPQTGSTAALPSKEENSSLSVALHFDPYATRVVVVRDGAGAATRRAGRALR